MTNCFFTISQLHLLSMTKPVVPLKRVRRIPFSILASFSFPKSKSDALNSFLFNLKVFVSQKFFKPLPYPNHYTRTSYLKEKFVLGKSLILNFLRKFFTVEIKTSAM